MKIRDAILAESLPLPPIPIELAYQYVIAGNGLFIRAECTSLEAMVPVALMPIHGLEKAEPYARFHPRFGTQKIPSTWLQSVLRSAREKLPNEAMYQFEDRHIGQRGQEWHCSFPRQTATPTRLKFEDNSLSVVDLHSHGALGAFFSADDDEDEKGLRFYVVIGKIDTEAPEISARVGVYGYTSNVPVETVFDRLPLAFNEVDPEVEQVLNDVSDIKPTGNYEDEANA